jgi:S1-C subfamily serine protease
LKKTHLGIANCSRVIFYFLICMLSVTPLCHAEMAVHEIADQAMASTLLIVGIDGYGEPVNYGSGFVFAPHMVATNAHVIEDAEAVAMVLMDTEEVYVASRLVAYDPILDLAIMEVDTLTAPALSIRSKGRLRIGDKVYALGNPMGLQGTFSMGNVSAFRKLKEITMIQMTTPLSPGSSGGPVLDSNCKVVGIATAQYTEGQNLNFAVPATYLKKLIKKHSNSIDSLRQYSHKVPKKENGEIKKWFQNSN